MAVKPKATLASHTAGIFADMTLDGPEIGTLVAVVDRAKNLPNRKTMGKQDPYCAMRLGKEAKKTGTDRRGGQTPKWDQELRFTVHDSPDYYKLKVSVFNDDKKTDLIGEAYVDLRDLIKPGGSSNDLWHQLNYKGKYAGDIRMEMTYYDIRPREDKVTEKRRHRDKTASVTSGSASTVTGPRQLGGPREVKRRPLPASPGTNTPSPVTTPQDLPPQPPAKLPLSRDVDYNYSSEQLSVNADHSQNFDAFQQPEDFDYYQGQQNLSSQSGDFYLQARYDTSEGFKPPVEDVLAEQFKTSTSSLPAPFPRQRSYFEETEDCYDSHRRHSEQSIPTEDFTEPRHPPTLIHHPNSAPEIPQYRPSRVSTSPTKLVHFRDSPLRHSINQQDDDDGWVAEPEQDDAPPPPPKHRESLPRKLQPDYPPSAYAPQPLRPTPRRPSVGDRGPLQSIEHEYSSYNIPAMATPPRQSSYDDHIHNSIGSLHTPERQHSRDGHLPSSSEHHIQSRPSSLDHHQSQQSVVLHQPQTFQDHVDGQSRRNSQNAYITEPIGWRPPPNPGYFGSRNEVPTNGGFSNGGSPYDSSAYKQSQSQSFETYSTPPIRPRPQTSTSIQTPMRKAVSPGPYPEQNDRALGSAPFGPDSYDVLNPASSPITNENTPFETHEQFKEAARLREVEKLREQGPIIGNDGRVIDPSDHLPSDTWAPEPERKQRKPEHVIHVRTKNEVRSRNAPGSAPASVRMNLPNVLPSSSSMSMSPASTSPSAGRNRLQKPNPTRPLPEQPYPRQRPMSSHAELPNQQAYQRNSYHEVSPGVARPSLSEYQVPVSNSYAPRGREYAVSASQQQRQPHSNASYVEDYHSDVYSDPLAAEMSMIDIGPSRGGRTVARSSRQN